VFNATFDPEEDKWKAAEFSNLVRDKGYYQAAFHSRLAERMERIGYGTEKDGNSFRLLGIDPDIAKRFARRTDIIESEAERLGITGNAKAKAQLGAKTREAKDPNSLTISELRNVWKSRLAEGEAQAIMEARRGENGTSPGARESMDYALLHCFDRQSAVPEKELLKTALIHGVGNASVADIKQELSRANILRAEKAGIRYATTKEVLNEETAMAEFVREGRGKRLRLGGILPPMLDERLSQEQRDAAMLILGSRDTVTALKGGAGTGKTTLIKETVKGIEATGKKVFTFAPSADASKGTLRSEGFANADTVEQLLINPKMQETVKGQVLWVDEAGLLSVVDIRLANGFVVPRNYGGISQGFVVTSHSSQGKTTDVALLALGAESLAAANREQAYVSISRGREAVRIYTDSKQEMLDAIKGSAARLSATELMQPAAIPKRKPSFAQRLIQKGFIQRTYSAMRQRMAAYARPIHHQPQREGLSLG